MRTSLMFSKASDEWATPDRFFSVLDAEFEFDLDAAASAETAKCPVWYGGDLDALALTSWGTRPLSVFLNPPYSKCRAFMAKASEQARQGHTVVCLVPSRTDTRWWWDYVWSGETRAWRPGVEVRFVSGRLKFGDGKNSAPFPSVVVIFRPLHKGIDFER